MKSPLYKKFKQLNLALSEGELRSAEVQLRNLHKESLPTAARALFKSLNHKFNLTNGAEIDFESPVSILAIKPERPNGLLASYDNRELLDGISLVSCCMNRNDNLKRSLRSWLKLQVHEIIIVDWNSTTPVKNTINDIIDDRVKIIRIENEPQWILTYAFNVGLRFASYKKLYKLDADIEVQDNFLELNHFEEGEFIRGSWKSAVEEDKVDQVYINGSFGCFKTDLLSIGLYNELIRTYGWDDSDLYERLASICGLSQKYLSTDSVFHLEQDESERIENQDVLQSNFLGLVPSTQFNNQVNKYLVRLYDHWNSNYLQSYSITKSGAITWDCIRVSESRPIPPHVLDDAYTYAALTWITNKRPEFFNNTLNDKELGKFLYQDYSNKVPFDETSTILGLYDTPHKLLLYREGIDSLQELVSTSERNSKDVSLFILAIGSKFQRYELTVNQRKIIIRIEIEKVYSFILESRKASLGSVSTTTETEMGTQYKASTGKLISAINLINSGFLTAGKASNMRKKIYIDAQHGLGNRLRAFASAAVIARNSDREVILVWEPDHHCNCRFSDLFDYEGEVIEKSLMGEIEQGDKKLYNYMEIEQNAEKDAEIILGNTDIYARSAYVLNSDLTSWDKENEFLRLLAPNTAVTELVNSVDVSGRLGAHVRMEAGKGLDSNIYDSVENWTEEGRDQLHYWRGKSHFSHFIKRIDQILQEQPAIGIFLAADLPETYASFTDYYGNRLVYLNRNAYDRSGLQLQCALADCILLSQCTHFLGSTWSSFSELAMRLSNNHMYSEMSGQDF